jgi:hypothetical protein
MGQNIKPKTGQNELTTHVIILVKMNLVGTQVTKAKSSPFSDTMKSSWCSSLHENLKLFLSLMETDVWWLKLVFRNTTDLTKKGCM